MNDNTLFYEAAAIWLQSKQSIVKQNTFEESYQRPLNTILLPMIGNRRLIEIDKALTVSVLSDLSCRYSDSVLRKCQISLRGVLNEAIDAGVQIRLSHSPIRIKSQLPKTVKHTYSKEQVELLEDYARLHRHGLSVIILLELGLRCSEMLGLRWSDLSLDHRSIHIRRACVEVGGKPIVDDPKSVSSIRELPVSDLLRELLSEQSSPPTSNAYLVNNKAHLMTPSNYTKYVYNPFFRDLISVYPHIPRLSPHELRHTCGTLLYERTGDLYAVSKFLGHSSVNITAQYYVHSDVELLRKRLLL